MLQPSSEIRNVTGLGENEERLARAYIQGAVYCWAKNRKDEPFAARDLFGGDNFDWDGTPLSQIYEKHKRQGKDNDSAVEDAGKDVGWLLKSVLHEDKRTFEVCPPDIAARYKWIGNEP